MDVNAEYYAYTNGVRMVIVRNIKNLGSQPIESVTVDEITAGDLILTQSAHTADGVIDGPHGDLTLSGLDDLGDPVNAGPNGSNSTTPAILQAVSNGPPMALTATIITLRQATRVWRP